jgi:NTE family protein
MPRESAVLVLQGGGALGAYQAGVFEALAEAGYSLDWVAGISIGAVNAAIIAGNPPERRVDRLREFWETVSASLTARPPLPGKLARAAFNESVAATAVVFGLPGFFVPRVPPAVLQPPGVPQALSFYDTSPLASTLRTLVDFDRLNGGRVRFSVGAVNVRTGNFAYFDTARQRIDARHVMASAALPPGFPPVEIDGERYWDGGLVSNTPLQYVVDEPGVGDLLLFQVDLFSARGPMPRTLPEVAEREKDIRFSSRTRLNTDNIRKLQALRRAAANLVAKLPEGLHHDPDAEAIRGLVADQRCLTIVHLIHRRKHYETQSKDCEFSRVSVEEHWAAGCDDARRSLRARAWRDRGRTDGGVHVFDLTLDAVR